MQIYALLDESRKPRYVGACKDAIARCQSHWYQRNRRETPVALWLRMLDNRPEVWIIQEVDSDKVWEAETYWINLLRATGADLLNLSEKMGFTSTSGNLSPETRGKISRANKGKKPQNVRYGTDNPQAKLTMEQAEAIRSTDGTTREIGLQFGVSRTTVSNIKRNRIYRVS
jgi:hypothetical protein